MKIQCVCGYIIVDQTNNIPYKASFFADQDYEASYDKLVAFIENLLQAKEANTLDSFLSAQFGDDYPKNLSISDIIADKLNGMIVMFGHRMYECNQCGRLWICPHALKDSYVTYLPEKSQRGILQSDREKS